MKKRFPNMARLIKESRGELSQAKLARKLGYKNGQYVSSAERELCSFPDEKIGELAKALDVEVDKVIQAKLDDHKLYLEHLTSLDTPTDTPTPAA